MWALKSQMVSPYETCPQANQGSDTHVECCPHARCGHLSLSLSPSLRNWLQCYLIPLMSCCFLSTGFLSSDSPAVYALSRFSLSDSPADNLCTPSPLVFVFRAFSFNVQMQPRAPLPCRFSVTPLVHWKGCASELTQSCFIQGFHGQLRELHENWGAFFYTGLSLHLHYS